jgi:hypothetical protein
MEKEERKKEKTSGSGERAIFDNFQVDGFSSGTQTTA